ncbi:hypothetical protein PDN64_12460 [Bacillus cereus group sp. Bc256]|uniref:hypothetical protein n=1 Tax=unclassified Bacillus cereus group TaxID=2750818 RepID=UPI001F565A60|nr:MULTISPECIES: hypothetical protein [unclassified Bacillus cereus group]MDA2138945.1 hypothetical protein [Bacillus cereus group sp. Bc256]MDA2598344.1 hypothetical protein [Bacillus cereus group sp. Bc061]
MATKVIDVAVATIRNTGSKHVSPEGFISGLIVRAVDDEQVFEGGSLYDGAMDTLLPGQSITVGIIKRLTVHHFDPQESLGYNQMLVFHEELKQRYVELGRIEEVPYFGPYSFKVHFDDIAGFQTFSVGYSTTQGHVIEVIYTVNLVASN